MSHTIVYVGEFILPDKGAAANRVVSNSKIFAEAGYNTVFLGASGSDEAFDGIRRLEGYENMFEEAHPVSSLQWARHIFSAENIVKLVDEYDAEFVVLYNLPIVAVFAVKLALKKRNTQIIYDCTEWTAFTTGSFLKRVFKTVDEWMVRNLLAGAVERIIVISDLMKEHYSGCGKLIKLPPLVDTDDEIWYQKKERSDGIFEFCFAGVPDGNKESLDKMLCAFSQIPDANIRFRIIGINKAEFIKNYSELSEIAEDRRIVFMGRLSHRETLKFVSECDCYIFIRVSDRRNNAGFPTKFSEAYTLDKSIITTNISDVSKYLEDGQGTVIDDVDVQTIKSAMLHEMKKEIRVTGIRMTFDYRNYSDKVKEFLR